MKVIVSHDVDHIKAWEHSNDLIIPKFLVRSSIELVERKISIGEWNKRIASLFRNKWNHIAELVEFNESQGVAATFFVGVNQGVGLNYKLEQASYWIKEILKSSMDCGVHGINYQSLEGIKEEYDRFKEISGSDHFGIRMHYLRNEVSTLNNLAKAGYAFDTTVYDFKAHYKIEDMYEFPLHVMDSYELENGKRRQSRNLKEAMASTIEQIRKAEQQGIPYFSLLFHDRYYDDSFKTWKGWYEEAIRYCKSQGYTFVNYKQAIKEING